MLDWINNNGLEALFIYYALSALIGSMPELPKTAGYWAMWGYGFLHVFSANLRAVAKMMKPDVPLPDDTGTVRTQTTDTHEVTTKVTKD